MATLRSPRNPARKSARRQSRLDQGLEPGLVVTHQDPDVVRPAGLTPPVDDRRPSGMPTLGFHDQRTLDELLRMLRLQCIGHGQAVGGMPAVAMAPPRPGTGLAG